MDRDRMDEWVDGYSPGEHIGDHLDFSLGGSNLLLRGHLGLATEEEGHCDGGGWGVVLGGGWNWLVLV